VVAGKFDEQKALEYLVRYFGALPNPDRKLQETYTEEPAQDGERVVTLRRVGDVGLVGLIYHVPAGPHPEFPAVEGLRDILGSEPSGRLYQAPVQTDMASHVSVNAQPYHDPGVLEINAEVNTKDRATLEKVRDRILAVIDDVVHNGVTQEEVDRAKQAIRKDYELDAHDPNRIAIELSEWAAQGDWRLYLLHRDRSEQVTVAQVQEVAGKYLKASNRTGGFFVPAPRPERTPVPEVPDITKLVAGYTGRQTKETPGQTFAVSPMALEAQLQRPEPIAGVRLALLPRKTRGESVQLRLTLHYGNA